MNIELGKRSGRRPGFLFAGPLARQTSFAGYQHPEEGRCRRGDGSVPQLRRSRFVTASARFGTLAHKTNRSALVLAVHRQLRAESSRTSISTLASTSIPTMNEPFQVKDFQRHLSGEQRSIPAGVMQAVLMHALQLRRSCREVFLLCDIQRHSLADAAAILGISQVVAKRRLQLARRRMDDVIERLCGPTREVAGPKSG